MSQFSYIDAFTAVAIRNADRKAFSTTDVALSFGDLLRLASQCARHCRAHGIRSGDRVGIALPRADDTLIAALACWMVGATCMVIDFRTKRPEKAALAASFSVKAFIEQRATSQSQDYLSVATGEKLAETVASNDDSIEIRPAEVHPAIIIRTSGTTGTPVGIVYEHDTLLRMHWSNSQFHFKSVPGLFVHAMPLFYSAGLLRTLSRLLDASPVHVLPFFASAEEIAECLSLPECRHTLLVPPQIQGLLDLPDRARPMFPHIATFCVSGGKVPEDAGARAYHELSNNLMIIYAASFGGHISIASGSDFIRKPGSVGRPHPHNHVRITDLEGNPVATGESGLICVRGPTVADAVLGEARALSDRLIDGWAVPGDLGFLDEEGFLTLTGRATDMIVRKGVNVYPREIEAVFESRDDVIEAAAVGFRHADAGEEIAVFAVVRSGVTPEMLLAHAKLHIVADKRPREIRIVETLPRNDAGKVLKTVLVETIETE